MEPEGRQYQEVLGLALLADITRKMDMWYVQTSQGNVDSAAKYIIYCRTEKVL